MDEKVDFIVVGSGISGLHAALVLAKFGKVLVVSKRKIFDSSTFYAQGGIAAVVNENDKFISHIKDTLIAGAYHNRKDSVSFLVERGPKVIQELEELGVSFDRETNGKFSSSLEAAHSFPRVLHATDFTGSIVERVLVSNMLKQKNIVVWENAFGIDLIVRDNICYGVYAAKDGMVVPVFSRATVLATGGVGHIYKWTTNPEVITGDGIAMADRAGAKLSDLEFVQFHPTALKENSSPLFLLSEALRGEGAVLKDIEGKRFMEKFDSRGELAPRDIVSRAIVTTQKDGDVFLDIRHRGEKFIHKRFPNICDQLEKRGFDLVNDLIPITPAEHFLCGGIETDNFGRTSIGSLFAYGEVAATGVHGANRLASNSLLEGFAYSGQVGYCVNELRDRPEVIPTKSYIYKNKNLDSDIHQKLQELMWENVGIERLQQGLRDVIEKLKKIEEKLGEGMEGNLQSWEIRNMARVGRLIAQFAFRQKESLGTHFLINEKH